MVFASHRTNGIATLRIPQHLCHLVESKSQYTGEAGQRQADPLPLALNRRLRGPGSELSPAAPRRGSLRPRGTLPRGTQKREPKRRETLLG